MRSADHTLQGVEVGASGSKEQKTMKGKWNKQPLSWKRMLQGSANEWRGKGRVEGAASKHHALAAA
jgi:hypothetical protein